MKTISADNYKTHDCKVTDDFNVIIFTKCTNCGLSFAISEGGFWSDQEDLSCKELLIKNIIE